MATTTIKLKRDSAANWSAENTLLQQGEPGFETDTGKYKVGDGVTTWNNLEYMVPFRNIESPDGTVSIEATNSANIVTGDFLPDADTTSDIGSLSKQFKDMYLSGTTLYIGGKPSSLGSDGKMSIDIADASLYGATASTDGIGAVSFSRVVYRDVNGVYLSEDNDLVDNNIDLTASTLAAVGTYQDADSNLAAVRTNPAYYRDVTGSGITDYYVWYFTKVAVSTPIELPNTPNDAVMNVSNYSGVSFGNLSDPTFTFEYDSNGDIISWELTGPGDPTVQDSNNIEENGGGVPIADGGLAVLRATPKTIGDKVSETALPSVKVEDTNTLATTTITVDNSTADPLSGVAGKITVTDTTTGVVGTITATTTQSADIVGYAEFSGGAITNSTNLTLSYATGTHDYTFIAQEADADYIVNITLMDTPSVVSQITLQTGRTSSGFTLKALQLDSTSVPDMIVTSNNANEPNYAITVYRMR